MSNKNFPPIFIINLKKDTHKKSHMISLCKKYNLNCEIINAVDGYSLDENEISKVYVKEKAIEQTGKPLTKGELGCALSHRSVYQKMVDEKIENAIILEDDIDIIDDFKKVIQNINKLPKNWELVLLGYHSNVLTEEESLSSYRYRKKIIEDYNSVRLLGRIFGTYGYLINLRGAKKLTKLLTIITQPLDYVTGKDIYINLYAIKPRLVKINRILHNDSNIESERQKFREDFIKSNFQDKKAEKVSILRDFLRKLGLGKLKLKLSIFYMRIKRLKSYD